MPDLGRRRLAHAVRQDMWRMLRDLRGFAPAVEVVREAGGLHLRAGGALIGRAAPDVSARIATMLAEPARRRAWIRAAGHST
jgi:hypothetical protein